MQDLAYQIRYTEENHRFPSNPWSVRQTGVYHHHSYKNDFDLFIFLHPLSESVLERQLLAWDAQSHASEIVSVCENPYRLHILPFAVYIDNWRWYFRSLGEDFEERVSQSLLSGISGSNHDTERPSHDAGPQEICRHHIELR